MTQGTDKRAGKSTDNPAKQKHHLLLVQTFGTYREVLSEEEIIGQKQTSLV